MQVYITGLEFAGIVCGNLFAIGLITFLVSLWDLKRHKLPLYDQE